jgi:hypothetical protein
MSICILENFWDNYKAHEELIRRCFFHHFNRHPDPEGRDRSFNNLLVKMHELNVFGRFDISKLVSSAGISMTLSENETYEDVLLKAGVDINKKWGQFIYKWIEKIINDEYNKNGRMIRKFIHSESLIDCGIPHEDNSSWINDTEEAAIYEKKFSSYTENRQGRRFTPSFRGRYIAGEEGFDNQLDAVEAIDIRDNIASKLSGKNDKIIFELLEQGMTEKEISGKLNVSQQYVGTIIRKIRGITSQLCFG